MRTPYSQNDEYIECDPFSVAVATEMAMGIERHYAKNNCRVVEIKSSYFGLVIIN